MNPGAVSVRPVDGGFIVEWLEMSAPDVLKGPYPVAYGGRREEGSGPEQYEGRIKTGRKHPEPEGDAAQGREARCSWRHDGWHGDVPAPSRASGNAAVRLLTYYHAMIR